MRAPSFTTVNLANYRHRTLTGHPVRGKLTLVQANPRDGAHQGSKSRPALHLLRLLLYRPPVADISGTFGARCVDISASSALSWTLVQGVTSSEDNSSRRVALAASGLVPKPLRSPHPRCPGVLPPQREYATRLLFCPRRPLPLSFFSPPATRAGKVLEVRPTIPFSTPQSPLPPPFAPYPPTARAPFCCLEWSSKTQLSS